MKRIRTVFSSRRWLWSPEIGISLALCLMVGFVYLLSRPEFAVYGHRLPLSGITELLDLLETKTLDMRFLWRGPIAPRDDIVIVAVDEKADDELGRWWTSGRKWIARLLDILHAGGARVIGFDLVLDEPDAGAAVTAVDEITAYYHEHLAADSAGTPAFDAFLQRVKQEHDYDAQLAQAIRQAGTVVLGYYHFRNRGEAEHLSPEAHAAREQVIARTKYSLMKYPPGIPRRELRVPHSYGVEVNLPIFSDAAKSMGYFNAQPHPADGYIRTSPLIMEYRGQYYPSLALQVAYAYRNPPLPPIIHALGGGVVDRIQLGNGSIPTNEQGQLMINYYGEEQQFPHYSISDVVLGRTAPDTFQDKIVMFGFTAPIYQDLHPISFQANFPGVETHATVIANILDQDFLTRPESTLFADLLLLAVLALLLGLVLRYTRPVSGALAMLACLAGVVWVAYYAFSVQKVWLNMVYPGLFILLSYVTITSYKYFTEERRKKAVKSAFQHYVAPTVVNQMLDQVTRLRLGGERKELTALFSDIRGFTSISEQMTPEELVRFLNEYLSAMTHIVLQYEGTVDKYMGDAIMAFYGAPLDQVDHAVRACRTALDMMARLRELRGEWAQRGLPPMDIGIGINSGEMSVGNMGSEERFDYTIMGDHVNLASRLEGINKQYGTNIVISQFTYALVRDEGFTVRELDAVQVKGRQEPVVIYELCGCGSLDTETERLFAIFQQGLAAYKHRQWQTAATHFQEALRLRPDDSPSRLYCERCELYQTTPPPEDWDGVFVMKTK